MSSYYSGTSGLGIGALGQATDTLQAEMTLPSPATSPMGKLMALGGTLSIPVLAYHGYKRNDSLLWASVWGFLGSMVWPVTVPVAFAQGYGKKKVRSNRRRPARRRTSRRPRRRRTSRRSR
jgi:hypothetical protein